MKKYQKLYQLKQAVKLDAEISKYIRLTGKKIHPSEYDTKLKELYAKCKDIDMPSGTGRMINIAYSLLKGKKYTQIEKAIKWQNILDDWEWKRIADIMLHFKDEENSAVIPVEPFPTTKISYHTKKESEVTL